MQGGDQSGARGVLGTYAAAPEERIVEAAQAHLSQAKRYKLSVASQYAQGLTAYLAKAKGVKRVEVAGSFRRMRETVGDLDILVAAAPGSPVMERLARYEEVSEVLSSGPTRIHRKRPDARRGQFDGEGNAVETGADLSDE